MSILEYFKNEKNRKMAKCVCEECSSLFNRRADSANLSICNKCVSKKAGKKISITKKALNRDKPDVYCCIDGCGRKAMYKTDKLCQKHYFRKMRYGTFELTSKRKYKIVTPNGYVKVYEPDCFLSERNQGYVYEHRFVYLLSGKGISNCELCNKDINWKTVHIDHIDNNRLNNNINNLRPLCNGCNTKRPYREKQNQQTTQKN